MIEEKSNRDEVKKESENIINAIKDYKINEGIIDKSPRVVIKDVDFAGKKLKISKSFVKNGKQNTLKAGTKWEDVSPFFKKHISFSQKDFNK